MQTDEDGIAEFETVVPGWYSGRAPHIHIKVCQHHIYSLLPGCLLLWCSMCCNGVLIVSCTVYESTYSI